MCAQRRDEKRIKKMRASRTCGYGTQGQHRKGGQRGGRGKAGYDKHKWTQIMNENPKYFGKHGFKRPPHLQFKDNIINIGDINEKIPELLADNIATKEGKIINLNLDELGFDKVLGMGKLDYPVSIKAKSFSQKAIEKVINAGGQALKLED